MKRSVLFLILICLLSTQLQAATKEKDTVPPVRWNNNLDVSLYIFSGEIITSPVYAADRNWLHMEARYNYEAKNTFSGWFGYNFTGGKKLNYIITPMVGGIAGEINGMAPGLEITLNYLGFSFFSESEYVFDFKDNLNNDYFIWTDLGYSPLKWLEIGLSMQRTRYVQTKVELQGGVFVGFTYKWFNLQGYLYKPADGSAYGIISFSANIPQY